MAKSRQKKTSKKTTSAIPSPPHDNRPSALLIMLTVSVLVARFLLPTEATADGETLWIALCTLGLGMVWVWDRFAARAPLFRWDWLTVAILLLVGGHLVSGMALLSRGGDKRAAVNMMWEWTALGVLFFAVRTVLTNWLSNERLQWMLTAVVVALAGLGLYQHYIWLPANAADYTEKRAELDQRESQTTFGSRREYEQNERRKFELRRDFLRQGIALEGPARRQWEDRLTSSREPFGTFGLANTFAGLLAAFLFPVVGLLAGGLRRRENWSDLIGPALSVALLTWCLVLTKSRTAWAGCLIGAVAWWWLEGRRSEALRRWFGWGMAGAAGIAVLVTVIAVNGGLDKQVISEAPKSMQYRLQYWTGTVDVIKEFPILGGGPGNFRSHYLKYKLPESSEEIRDPHNLVLDVWCNGGLLGLVGLLLMIGGAFRSAMLENRVSESAELPQFKESTTRPTAWILGVIVGFLTVAAMFLMRADDHFFGRTIVLLVGTITAMLLLRVVVSCNRNRATQAAALVALTVHLCGAGGIGMPAITQVLFILCLAVAKPKPQTTEETRTVAEENGNGLPLGQLTGLLAGSGIIAVLLGGCLTTALIPNFKRSTAVDEANYQLQERGTNTLSERLLQTAVDADPLSADPLRTMSDVYFSRWQKPGGDPILLHRAIELRRLAISRDPNRFRDHWRLGIWLADEYTLTRRTDTVTASIAAFDRALSLYPHNALLLAQYADALSRCERTSAARDIAIRAIAQDDINREEGHLDKVLPKEVRRQMESLRDEQKSTGN